MIINSLGINITKNCNLNCAHCLCGNAKNECMTKDVIKNAFKGIERIDELYLTGGEPFLRPDIIYMVIDELKKQNIEVKSILLTTNGTIFDDEVKQMLISIFDGVDGYITVSKDKYHKNSICEKLSDFDKKFIGEDAFYKLLILRMREFCLKNKINFNINDIAEKFVAKMGRAKDIEGAMEISQKIYALGNYSAKNHLYVDEVIIDTTGHVLRCDYENDDVENLSIGNVLDNTLEELIFSKCSSELEGRGLKYEDDELTKQAIDVMYAKKQSKQLGIL